MASLSVDPRLSFKAPNKHHPRNETLTEEIEGLIKVYRDGYVERPPIIPTVSCTTPTNHGVITKDIMIDKYTSLWARVFVPTASTTSTKVSVLVYFHGGGFCVGSAAWHCYHEFLSQMASKVGCIILSVNYRLAPENRLPTAYDDGYNAVFWLKQLASRNGSMEQSWWLDRCNFSNFFLAGDSAGANVAYNVALRLGNNYTTVLKPLCLKGIILIQPFFGGETRTASEKIPQPSGSVLSLSASDTYWRLSLPVGCSRDHPWSNPLANGGASKLRNVALPPVLVCVSEMDILKDRDMEFCAAMSRAGKTVQTVITRGVGHGFQILNNSAPSQARTQEMISGIKGFVYKLQ